MFLDHCTERCGCISAIIAAIAFGSFGVPIKQTKNINVDPLVMQTYMTSVVFLTSFLVIPLGEKVAFTPLGIISGLFWIPGGVGAVYGIRHAGLAVSVGTWSSLNVLSSFCWGMFVFGERVKSLKGVLGALFLLNAGLVGMSLYSSPQTKKHDYKDLNAPDLQESSDAEDGTSSPKSNRKSDSILETDIMIGGNEMDGGYSPRGMTITRRGKNATETSPSKNDLMAIRSRREANPESKDGRISLFRGRIWLTRRQLGVFGAVVNGTVGSCKYVPMYYADEHFNGAGFLISYSCGSMLVIVLAWVLRLLYNIRLFNGNIPNAYDALPSFHFRHLCRPGFAAGLIWSIANFGSIISVAALGQGVGYSLIQGSMLVSGLWGILFGEIKGSERIWKWLTSSIVTIVGIVWLSYEHK